MTAGTDATMAEHISKIQERNYVTLTPERTFTPTNLGLALVDGANLAQHEKSYLVQDMMRWASTFRSPSRTCAASSRLT